jgi:hypothetical protein
MNGRTYFVKKAHNVQKTATRTINPRNANGAKTQFFYSNRKQVFRNTFKNYRENGVRRR